jgi:hypothetical protein
VQGEQRRRPFGVGEQGEAVGPGAHMARFADRGNGVILAGTGM